METVAVSHSRSRSEMNMEDLEVESESEGEETLGSSLTMVKVAAAKKFIENHYRDHMKNIQGRKESFLYTSFNEATIILNKKKVVQPAANDSTATVIVIISLSSAVFSSGMAFTPPCTSLKAIDVLTAMVVLVKISDNESLIKCASHLLLTPCSSPGRQYCEKYGGTVDDKYLVKGFLLYEIFMQN